MTAPRDEGYATDTLSRLGSALGTRYRLDRELGRGGAAIVYLAEDTKHQRRVAIKVLKPGLAQAIGADRLLREIGMPARLGRPTFLRVHDAGGEGGLLYYVMPYVEGGSLRDRLDREKQLGIEEAVSISRD